MPEIVLSTLNAKFIHAAFGLRYLMANLGPLQARARLIEFDINQRPLEIVEALLALDPKIIGLGIYIWNVAPTTEVVAMLKRLRPDLIVILADPGELRSRGATDRRVGRLCHHGRSRFEICGIVPAIVAGKSPAGKNCPRRNSSAGKSGPALSPL